MLALYITYNITYMIATLNNFAIKDLANSPHNNNFGIPQAQARFLFASLNLELKKILNSGENHDRDNYSYLVKNENFWGYAVCKKLYENLDLVTKYYKCLLSNPKDYQYIICFINFLYDLSYSSDMLPQAYYEFILTCVRYDEAREREEAREEFEKEKIIKDYLWKKEQNEKDLL